MLIETQLSNQDENEDEERKESDGTGLVQNIDIPSNSAPTQAEGPVYTLVQLQGIVVNLQRQLASHESLLTNLAFPPRIVSKRSESLEGGSRKRLKCHGDCCIRCSAFCLS